MRIEIRPAKKGQFTWAFVETNGKQTANNEPFASRGNAIRAVKAHVDRIARLLGVVKGSYRFIVRHTKVGNVKALTIIEVDIGCV
jgi:uncharacterized protein YegP (UPF0339 family)